MKDTHLTLRIPTPLADALDAYAAHRGVPRSAVVREAVSSYVIGPAPVPTTPISGAELARRWAQLPVLGADARRAFAEDIVAARADLAPPIDPWA
jgi:hypothetical protein